MLYRFICHILTQLNPLHRSIGLVLPQFNVLPTDGLYILILWTHLLLLVGGCLWLEALGLGLADAVEQQNSSKDTNNKSNHYCNCHSNTYTESSLWDS